MFQKLDLFLAPTVLGLLERANPSCWTAHVIWSGKLLLALTAQSFLAGDPVGLVTNWYQCNCNYNHLTSGAYILA
jgi:hypothetical protein